LSHQRKGAEGRNTLSSLKSIRSQNISIVVIARDLYLASMLDLETTYCFLVDQEMRQSPKNIAKPVVEQRSSGHPAKLEPQKALS
jgi:hypothetical protein